MIVTEQLVKVYAGFQHIRALDGVDLRVEKGEVFGLLGPNGAGKTTTVGICTTRVLPTAGRALIDGIDVVGDAPSVKKRIGVVTQFNTLDRSCTVWENLYFHCLYFGMGHRGARDRANQLLDDFRLRDRARAMPDELSGGMAQRLQVARAIAHHPAILFLDEPTAGLDPQSRIALWQTVQDLRSGGTTILLTTHYMEEADQLCDRVAIIDHGNILVCDTPAMLKRTVGADTVIELRFDEQHEGLRERLVSLPGVDDVEATETGLRVMAKQADGLLPRIVEAAQPCHLRDVSVTEATLETVFIRLTGRDLRD